MQNTGRSSLSQAAPSKVYISTVSPPTAAGTSPVILWKGNLKHHNSIKTWKKWKSTQFLNIHIFPSNCTFQKQLHKYSMTEENPLCFIVLLLYRYSCLHFFFTEKIELENPVHEEASKSNVPAFLIGKRLLCRSRWKGSSFFFQIKNINNAEVYHGNSRFNFYMCIANYTHWEVFSPLDLS